MFGARFDADEVIARAHAILSQIDGELVGRNWIIGGAQPTVADIALYSYIANAPEGNVDLAPYPQILTWLRRVEGLDGFVPFQRTVAGLRIAA